MRWTVGSFYRRVYVPNYLVARNAANDTIESYGYSVRLWCSLVGDTTLQRLNNRVAFDALLGKWIGLLRDRPGIHEDLVGAHTINRHLRHMRAVFNRAHRLGLLTARANVELLRAPHRTPRFVPEQCINAIYRSCRFAKWPKCARPSDWWRALVVLAWNTGLRRRTLLSMPRECFRETELIIPGKLLKGGIEQVIPLNDCVQRHIKRLLRHGEPKILPWPHCRRIFYEQWHDIQERAGLPRPHFKIHDIRRTCATELARNHGPDAAQRMLGHTSFRTTSMHYINWTELLRSAVKTMPQPRSFRA